MTSSVTLNEQKVIGLLRTFVQETELGVHTLTTEEVQDVPQLPRDVASLGDEIVAGNWRKSLQLLNGFVINNSGLLTAMKCSICRQRYLESIDTLFSTNSNIDFKKGLKEPSKEELVKFVDPEQLKLVASNLKSLEKLCSQDDYFKYSFLISCPDLKTHPNYSDWSVESGRLNTASEVCQLAMKTKYPSLLDRHYGPATKPKQCNRLLQLVAKGFLYEKCEKFLQQQRSGSDNKRCCSELGEMLDVHSWLEQLQEGSFQMSPRIISLCIEEQRCIRSTEEHHDSPQGLQNGHLPTNTGDTENTIVTDSGKATTLRFSQPEGVNAKNGPLNVNHVEDDDDDRVDVVQERKHQHSKLTTETSSHVTQKIMNSHKTSSQPDTGLATVAEHFVPRDIYTPENCQIQVEPLINSSTPKPSHSKHAVMLPVTSPIHHDNVALDYGPYHTPTSLKKQVTAMKRPEDMEFPRYHMVASVKESQAVRAVTFDPAGQFVAIGANSKSLRVCSLLPILQPDNDENESLDLPVLYHHPKYHKGSVYCLAWSNEGLIASGSNDQTIRLLKFDSDSSTVAGPPEDIHIHKATIRDVLFLANGYLLSAGAGDCTVKVYDCLAERCVRNYSSHSSQVLALSSITEDINQVLSAGHDHNLVLWDVRQPQPVHTSSFSAPLTSVTNHNKDICVSLLDGSLEFLDLRQFSIIHELQYLHRDECRSASYSPDGHFVLSGSYDNTIQLTNVYSKISQVAAKHSDKVVQCRWHCSGDMFASTSVDKHVCLWKA